MKHMIKGICLITLLLSILCLTSCQESTNAKYERANKLLAEGKYADAATLFEDISTYEDSSKMSLYAKAINAAENRDYETAFSTFLALEDFKDSSMMITYYNGRRAEDLAEPDEKIAFPDYWFAAIDSYEAIPLFRDSMHRAESCKQKAYDYAIGRGDHGNTSKAISILTRLKSYSDSSKQIVYYDAMALYNEKKYKEASEKFSTIPDFRDADALVTAVMDDGFNTAVKLEEEGKLDDAHAVFLTLGDYKDADTRAYKLYYDAGVKKRESHDWIGAVNAFTSAGNYSDSNVQILATYYLEGISKREQEDWSNAVTAFELAGNYEDAQMQVKLTYYIEGERKRDAKDYLGAINAFSKVLEYKDAKDQINECRYVHGLQLMTDGSYDNAIVSFILIPDYKDSSEKLKECYNVIYNLGVEAEKNSNLVKARYYYSRCGEFKDSKDRIKSIEKPYRNRIALGGSYYYGIKQDNKLAYYCNNSNCWIRESNNFNKWSNLISITAGNYHVAALKADGRVVSGTYYNYDSPRWKNAIYNTENWTNIIEISAGFATTTGLKADGTVVVTGDVGYKEKYAQTFTMKVKDVKAIGGGYRNDYYLLSNGTVVISDHYYPEFKPDTIDGWSDIEEISVGYGIGHDFVLGRKKDGTVLAYGKYDNIEYANEGQLDVDDWNDIIAIAAGERHSVGLKSDGTVVAVGNFSEEDSLISEWTDIMAIYAKGALTVGIKEDGTILSTWVRGNNFYKWNLFD